MSDNQRHKDLRMDGILIIEKSRKLYIDAKNHYDEYDKSPNITDKELSSFLLQRALEIIVKGMLNYYYSEYSIGHGLTLNINKIQEKEYRHKELCQVHDTLSELTKYDFILEKWEKNNTYKGVKVKTKDLLSLFDLYEELWTFVVRNGLNVYEKSYH